MIQPDASRIRDLTADLKRCRQELSETDNANAREICERVILRYESMIAALSRAPVPHGGKAKPAKR